MIPISGSSRIFNALRVIWRGFRPAACARFRLPLRGSRTAVPTNMSGTSEVPQLPDPLCATRKSAEVGHFRTPAPQQTHPEKAACVIGAAGHVAGFLRSIYLGLRDECEAHPLGNH